MTSQISYNWADAAAATHTCMYTCSGTLVNCPSQSRSYINHSHNNKLSLSGLIYLLLYASKSLRNLYSLLTANWHSPGQLTVLDDASSRGACGRFGQVTTTIPALPPPPPRSRPPRPSCYPLRPSRRLKGTRMAA
eukprot:97291-Prorocentrum_minimum.AAC.1